MGLRIQLVPMGVVIAFTLISNLALVQVMRIRLAHRALVPAVLVLDVCLLTALLYFSGGTDNPFAILYIVHIVMSVAVLGPAWTWLIVAIACGSFALLLTFHRPLTNQAGALPHDLANFGRWTAFALVALLIGYFVRRVTRALRQRENELQATRERASRSEQLASLTTLAAGAAHELGTPLGTIAVTAKELELAAGQMPIGESMAEDARLIRQEVDRCRRILDRMRVDIVEDLQQKTTTVAVQTLLDQLRGDLTAEEVKRLKVSYPPAVREITGPVRAIQQAVVVLVRNALDAMPGEMDEVTLTVERSNGSSVFTVEDKGHGMPDDVLRRAGQPFFTTKAPGKGMGLGLFLVRLVAERYGGQFELQSTPGAGTVSRLIIPESADEHADASNG
jgi:two-component system sensor histidine kinase RegB